MKQNAMEFQKELTLVLTQKIGNLTWEIEARDSDEQIELTARDEDGHLEVMETIEAYDLEVLSRFFKRANEEVLKLKAQLPGAVVYGETK